MLDVNLKGPIGLLPGGAAAHGRQRGRQHRHDRLGERAVPGGRAPARCAAGARRGSSRPREQWWRVLGAHQYRRRAATPSAAGLIQSEMAAEGMKSAAVQQAAEDIVLSRLGTPEEVAQTAVYLASDASSYITAQTVNVNGGLYF
ncbi:MAG: SDR family oxidoreductase [Balneolaceae bacterium]|nr:SDR family oxidoreductase [Balneolaceae bacterium]